MAQDEGDSSDADSSIYTATNVLLGYASKEPTDDTFSQLGGRPVILPPNAESSNESNQFLDVATVNLHCFLELRTLQIV